MTAHSGELAATEQLTPVHERLALDAADRVFRAGVLTGTSAFDPAVRIWTAETTSVLRSQFVERPDESKDVFLAKLARQLDGAGDDAVLLAAELLYTNMLPLEPGQIGLSTKQKILDTVLSWAQKEISVPGELTASMRGFMNGGQAFLNYRPFQLQFLILLVDRLVRLRVEERTALLAEPLAFRDACNQTLDAMGDNKARAQLHTLLYLMFPQVFIPSANFDHKDRIRAVFLDRVPQPKGDVDLDLLEIQKVLSAESGGRIDFYSDPWYHMWNPPAAAGGEQRGWLVRGANVGGRNYVGTWISDGFCSVSWPEVGPLPANAGIGKIKDAVEAALTDSSAAQRNAAKSQLHRFLTVMNPGDLVVTVDGDDVYVGTINGDAYSDQSDPGMDRRRPVSWHKADTPLSRTALPVEVQAALKYRQAVADISPVAAAIAAAADLGEQVGESLERSDETTQAVLAGATRKLADELLIPYRWLDTTLTLLQRRHQLILYGPPGTGKTYLARKLAAQIADPENIRFVQFHPSYTYEDFFEGFRPLPGDGGTVVFDLVDGPLRVLAKDAKANPGRAYVLVIDEINRANLAKVFGELYFLLEYRNEPITTQYRPNEDFLMPDNVYFIGTMNTADRSIALVDAAMRRRFAFRQLAPTLPPINKLLRAWLKSKGLTEKAADLLDELNHRLGDPDRAIGPSYLMDLNIDHPGELELIWESQILPLLADQFHGAGIDVEVEYGLDSLRGGLTDASPTGV